ncbi:hypothetical protein ACFX2I_027354 [Malus domestica]|uniref:RNase H type-1 domain-containing protein n=1 Tax=Malus domestica TaxID=3750 RepID=A0A498KN67_MALDO|nr:hypothetical protein DVH24_026271 [Malus domestica]
MEVYSSRPSQNEYRRSLEQGEYCWRGGIIIRDSTGKFVAATALKPWLSKKIFCWLRQGTFTNSSVESDSLQIISGFAALKGTSVDVYPIGHIVEDFKALLSVITEASIATRPSLS